MGSMPRAPLSSLPRRQTGSGLAKTRSDRTACKTAASGGHLWGRGEEAWGRRDCPPLGIMYRYMAPVDGGRGLRSPPDTTLLCRSGGRRRQAGSRSSRFPGSSSWPAAPDHLGRPTRTTRCNGRVRVPVLHSAWLPRGWGGFPGGGVAVRIKFSKAADSTRSRP